MTTPHLFHFRVSHYNEKVRWALDWKGVAHRRTTLVPGFHLPVARTLSGQNKLPIVDFNGTIVFDSSRLLEEIERRYPEPPLFPEGAAERERARAIEDYFDEHVAPDVRRLFWATYLDDPDECARMATAGAPAIVPPLFRALFPLARPIFRANLGADRRRLARARDRLTGHFDRLEAEIGPSGYLVGERFGVADLSAASVMTAILRPPEFPYPLPDPWPRALTELRSSLSHRKGFRWVLDMYARHRGPSSEVAA